MLFNHHAKFGLHKNLQRHTKLSVSDAEVMARPRSLTVEWIYRPLHSSIGTTIVQFESDCVYSVKTIATLLFLKAFAMPGQPKTSLQRHSHSSQKSDSLMTQQVQLFAHIYSEETDCWGMGKEGRGLIKVSHTERVKRLWEPLYPFSSHDSDCDSWNANGSRSTATNRTPGARCKIVLEWPPPPKVMSITVCRSKGGKTELCPTTV